MGLDQNAYKVPRHADNTDFFYPEEAEVIELAYWRKHPNLEGWMAQTYNQKADAQGFVGRDEFSNEIIATAVEVNGEELSEDKLNELKDSAINDKEMKELIQIQSFIAMTANIKNRRIFNCQPIRLTVGDLDQLEMHVKNNTLPDTEGFFFGVDSDDHYREQDLKFIKTARQAIADGFDVYYQSWW